MHLKDYRALASRRRHKYGAQRTQAPDGTWFASKAECAHYLELCLLKRAGKIRDLQLQPRFKLVVNGLCVGVYVADFAYVKDGESVATVVDVKGVRTDVFRLKKLLMKACHGIDVVEIGKPKRDVEDRQKIRRKAKMIY